jgi:K319L-like, PKD domain
MRPTQSIFVVAAIIAAIVVIPIHLDASVSWEITHPANSQGAGFRDVGLMGINKLYTVGTKSMGLFGEERAWVSSDGGATYQVQQSANFGNLCDFAFLYDTYNSTDFLNLFQGAVAGGSVPPTCQWLSPSFPLCEVCLLRYEPTVWTTSDGGASLARKYGRGEFFGEFFFVDYLSNDHIIAGGNGGSIVECYSENCQLWATITGPLGNSGTYTDSDFYDGEFGVIAATVVDDDRLSADFPQDAGEAIDRIATLHEARQYLKDPVYRLKARARKEAPAVAATMGGCYLTEGGRTWQTVFEKEGEAALLTSFYSARYGFVITDEPDSPSGAQFTLYYTHDGGDHWETGDLPEQGIGGLPYDAADVKYLSSKLGYIAGASVGEGVEQGFVLQTNDGGATWSFMLIQPPAPLRNMDFFNRQLGYIVGDKSFTARYVGTNEFPQADAGPNQTVALEARVRLDGSGADDPDDFIDSYQWEQTQGEEVDLMNPQTQAPHFIAFQTGVLKFKLTIEAGGQTDTDTVKITVSDDVNDDADDDNDDDGDDDDFWDDDADDDVDDGDDDDDNDDDDDDSGEINDDQNENYSLERFDDEEEGGCCG